MPAYAAVFMLFMLASVGLPGTSGFVGEILVIIGVFQVDTLVAALAATGMILGAAYMLWLYRRVIFGALVQEHLRTIRDLRPHEVAAFAPLVDPGAADGHLSGAVPRPDGGLGRPAAGAGRARRQPRPPPRSRPAERGRMLELAVFDLAPAITEILLACVALALLMVGVFRGSEPAAARLVMPLAVMALVIGLFVLIVGQPRARRRPSAASSSPTASRSTSRCWCWSAPRSA